ncbi:hypothetical protein L914_04007, partial [Phytophthora nicotianae]
TAGLSRSKKPTVIWRQLVRRVILFWLLQGRSYQGLVNARAEANVDLGRTSSALLYHCCNRTNPGHRATFHSPPRDRKARRKRRPRCNSAR